MKIPQIGRSDYNCLSLPISNSKLFASLEPKGFSDWWALRPLWGLSKENCCGSFFSWKGHVSGEEHHSLVMKTRNQGILGGTWCSEIWSRERDLTLSSSEHTSCLTRKRIRGIWTDWVFFLPQKLEEFMETKEQVSVLISSIEDGQSIWLYRTGFPLASGYLLCMIFWQPALSPCEPTKKVTINLMG